MRWRAPTEVAQSWYRLRYGNVDVVAEHAGDGVGYDVVVNGACEEACGDVAPPAA